MRVSGSGGGDDSGHRDAGLLGEKLADRTGQRREGGERLLFRIQTAEQPVFLCLEGFEQKQKPRMPCGLWILERGLGLAQGQIITFLVGLDDTFQAGIRDVAVAGL